MYMLIEQEKVVSVAYELRLDNQEGELVEQRSKDEPMTFLYGSGNLLNSFEEQLEGKEPGSQVSFQIESENAYGAKVDEAVVDLPKHVFEVDGQIDENILKVDNVIPMKDAEGNEYQGIVKEIKDENVTMDFNHPLAGQNLFFSVEVLDVREATKEEIEQGQANTGESNTTESDKSE